MVAKRLAVLDIGSDAVTLVMQDNKYRNNFIFKGTAEYAGFQDGEFLDITGLFKAVGGLIKECADTTFSEIKEVLVGVPGEFTTVVTKTVQTKFAAQRRVTDRDVEKLFDDGNVYDNHPSYKAINASPIYFCGADGVKTINPKALTTDALSAAISYVLCERSFISLFDKLAGSLDIIFEYTSTALAELMFVVPPENRDNGVIIADVGYITTTVSYGKGDGLLASLSFSLGGGNIAGDLTTYLDIPFSHARELVPKINLNLNPMPAETYYLSVRGEAFEYNISDVNAVARYRVEDIAEKIALAISTFKTDIPPGTTLLLTGSGISTTVGAREIIAEASARRVKVVSPSLLQFNKPKDSGIAGLISVQQQRLTYGGKSFLDKVKELLTKHRRKK